MDGSLAGPPVAGLIGGDVRHEIGGRVDLKWLETFVTVARRGTMSAAAVDLGYSRSTVTHHVQSLERAFGAQLLDRREAGGTTAAGTVLLEHAEEVLRRVERARAQIIRSAGAEHRTLRLGATEAMSVYRLPAVLHLLRRVVPEVHIEVEVDSATAIDGRLRLGRLDVVLTASITRPTGLASRVLGSEEVAMVTGRGRGARQASRRVLVPQRGCVYREIAEAEYLPRVHGAEVVQMGSLEAVKSAVVAQLGIGLLPLVAVEQQVRQGQLTILPWRPRSRVTTRLAWNEHVCPADIAVHLARVGKAGPEPDSGDRAEPARQHELIR